MEEGQAGLGRRRWRGSSPPGPDPPGRPPALAVLRHRLPRPATMCAAYLCPHSLPLQPQPRLCCRQEEEPRTPNQGQGKVTTPIPDGLREFLYVQMRTDVEIFTVAKQIEENNCGS